MTTNGQLDTSTLTPVRSQPSLRLTAAAEAAFAALRAAVYAAYGWWLTLTDAYRDYATQERIFRQRYTTTYLPGRPRKWWLGRWWYLKAGYATAAVPGTSNHGWGTTVDITGLGGFGGAKSQQLASVAPNHGWSNAEGASIGEAWHWNHVGTATPVSNPISGGAAVPDVTVTPPAPIEEDDMPYTPEEIEAICKKAALAAVVQFGRSEEFQLTKKTRDAERDAARKVLRADVLEQANKSRQAVYNLLVRIAKKIGA